MRLSRRAFLKAAGCCGIAAGLHGTPAVSAPRGTDLARARHVLNRCGYGPVPGEVARVSLSGIEAYIQAQLHPETLPDREGDRRVRRLETLRCPVGELFEYKEAFLWDELASGKLLRACYSEHQLYEVMVDFWTDHFNIDSSKGDCGWLKMADDRDVIRKHALGNFHELLRASALGPAMLWYLDGRQNRRSTPEEAPNENFARELLELHTVGVDGGYDQRDVMEVARCLTGWTVRTDTWFGKGRVEFIPDLHDDGEKRVLGVHVPAGQGRADADQVLRIAGNHPATASHLAKKLCRRFIGSEVSEETVHRVAAAFRSGGGEIRSALTALFRAPEIQNPSGVEFKRPFHFLVAALRATRADVVETDSLLDYLARMGHSPFQYPSPDGYSPEGPPWYGSMLWRWHFAYTLSKNEVPGVTVDWPQLIRDAGGGEALASDWLGRALEPQERQLIRAGSSPGLILASPALQGC